MVIDDFHIRRAARTARPCEADSPLRVDPYAELASAIASQSFKTITS
jgi:3-methyladenine DNA glycosylase/8-oxoguanine DNA glycosylase